MKEIPKTLKAAIIIIWLNSFLGFLNPAMSATLSEIQSDWGRYALLGFYLVFTPAFLVFISWKIVQGRNWMRIFLLISGVLGWPFLILSIPQLSEGVREAYASTMGIAILGASICLSLAELVLLFLPTSNAWFRRKREELLKAESTDVAKKSRGIALLLCVFLGGFGAHRFYAGRVISGIGLLSLILSAMVAFIAVASFSQNSEPPEESTELIVLASIAMLLMMANMIWVLVDIILIAFGFMKDKHGNRITSWGAASARFED